MRADFLAISAGFCLFSLVAFLPGYAIGQLTNVLRFRERSFAFRLTASAPLSIAIGPVLSYTVGRWFSLNVVWGVYAVLGLVTLAYARGSVDWRRYWPFLGLIGAWLSIAMLSLADLQIGRRLYFSVIAFDYAVRTEFTQSIAAFGIPAQNPFFFPGHEVALRYHYFWIVLSGLVHRLSAGLGAGFVDARQAFIAGSMWCGIGLICMAPLYLRLFSAEGRRNLERRSLIGIALLGVTGLDILPALFMVRLEAIGMIEGVSPSLEWWNNQVDGWMYTMLWEPHYLCATIASFMGFLILWEGRGRVIPAIVAGLAFASAAGAGIYVAFVFAVFLANWTAIAIAKKWYREAGALAIAGVVACVCIAPYLLSLRTSQGASTGSLFQFTVRSFELAELFLKLLHLGKPWQIVMGDVLLLPLNYLLELGFFFAVGAIVFVRFRRAKRQATRAELAAFAMLGTSVFICTFLKSGVIANNDLGWRGFLIAQFVLLLWGADVLAGPLGRRKALLGTMIALGAAGVVYDLAILRFFPLLSDAGRVPKIAWLANDRKLGLRTYANREAYEWLRARTSTAAILQQNPEPVYQDTFWGMYGQRRTVAEDAQCGTAFGGDAAECRPILSRLKELYAVGGTEAFDAACQALPVDVFIAKDTDAAWLKSGSWMRIRRPVFENEFIRLFPCHPL